MSFVGVSASVSAREPSATSTETNSSQLDHHLMHKIPRSVAASMSPWCWYWCSCIAVGGASQKKVLPRPSRSRPRRCTIASFFPVGQALRVLTVSRKRQNQRVRPSLRLLIENIERVPLLRVCEVSSCSIPWSNHRDNDNDNDTHREVPHPSNEGLALQARVSGPWPHKKNLFYW